MTAATGTGAQQTEGRSDPRIEQRRTLPPDIRALSPMADPDDVDLTVLSGTAVRATPEAWMRTAFEDEFRSRSGRLVLCGLLQLRLAPAASSAHVGGWTIAESGPDRIRLEARGWMLESHLVLRVEPDGVSAATLVRYRHPLARLIWGRVASPIHRGELIRLLGQAAQRLARRPWRIVDLVPDFTLDGVWQLPVHGDADDFADLIALMTSEDDLLDDASLPARALWHARDRLGAWIGLGRTTVAVEDSSQPDRPIPGTNEASLCVRLPGDLRGTAADVTFASVPFRSLYRTDDEFAAELSNRTVHDVMHLGWVADGAGRFHGEMTSYVKPRGVLGKAYMALIEPLRSFVVYPALMKQMEQAWNDRSER